MLHSWISSSSLTSILFCGNLVNAAYDIGYGDDSDLTNFVTRPEIKAPRFKVTTYEPNEVDAGYWFVGPYADVVQETQPRKYYQACQTGPHIYDNNGDLIWSGACAVFNQNTCDFRAWNWNQTFYLTGILCKASASHAFKSGHGILLDSSYRFLRNIDAPPVSGILNMHELGMYDNGNTAVYINSRPEKVSMKELGLPNLDSGWIINLGIQEYDLVNNKSRFDWWAYPEIRVTESNLAVTGHQAGWDWLHGNSIDRSDAGDYLYSARYTDAIYKVSGRTGTIIWRLGGKLSDFKLDGFNFSRQHDARFLESGDDYEIISFLDNGGDDIIRTATYSSGVKLYLDKKDMTARVMKRWIRPDERRSLHRGNFQALPSGHWFGGWSDNCHISEHSADGRLLMEAEFMSERFVVYRAWKFNFTGNPVEPPVLKAFAYGLDAQTSTVVYYVSWNGATEVASWQFWREGNEISPTELVGSETRTGFETQFQSRGYAKQKIYAQAVDSQGRVLGRSASVDVEDMIAYESDVEIQSQEGSAGGRRSDHHTEL